MRDKSTPDYYAALHVAENATDTDIRRQYRILSKQHHPDMGGSQEEMAKINEAYDILSDQFKRSLYDAERRRTIHVPTREPAQPFYTPPRHQPTPRTQTHFATQPTKKKRSSWWVKLVWGFTVVVLTIGVLTQLPLAQSNATSDPQTTGSQPLSVTYPTDDSTNAGHAPSPAAPDSTSDSTSAEAPTTSRQNTTCSNDTSTADCYSSTSDPTETCTHDSCQNQQTQSQKNCVTKTFGLYHRTVCNSPNGSNTCTNNTIGNQHYTTCE